MILTFPFKHCEQNFMSELKSIEQKKRIIEKETVWCKNKRNEEKFALPENQSY